ELVVLVEHRNNTNGGSALRGGDGPPPSSRRDIGVLDASLPVATLPARGTLCTATPCHRNGGGKALRIASRQRGASADITQDYIAVNATSNDSAVGEYRPITGPYHACSAGLPMK